MTKFKVGDRVRVFSVSDYDKGEGIKIGDIVTVQEESSKLPFCEYPDGRVVVLGIDQIEPVPKSPKTYTLTPYIKPETVTIKGVEYIMTENV